MSQASRTKTVPAKKGMRVIRVEPEVQEMLGSFVEKIGETYGDVVKRIAEHYAACPEVKKEKKH